MELLKTQYTILFPLQHLTEWLLKKHQQQETFSRYKKRKKERVVCILGRIKNTVTETILSNNELQSFEFKEPKPIL